MSVRLFTIGHSSRDLAAFLDLLSAHRIARIVDVRRFPASRRHPHFGGAALSASLAAAGFGYDHRPGLGGMRDPDGSEINAGLADVRLRAYADHMRTPAFDADLSALIALAGTERIACMCAEADPAHCHRSLLADALVANGVAVDHILDRETIAPHVLHRGAIARAGRVEYPARQAELKLF